MLLTPDPGVDHVTSSVGIQPTFWGRGTVPNGNSGVGNTLTLPNSAVQCMLPWK